MLDKKQYYEFITKKPQILYVILIPRQCTLSTFAKMKVATLNCLYPLESEHIVFSYLKGTTNHHLHLFIHGKFY
jgi:hypothetical protein